MKAAAEIKVISPCSPQLARTLRSRSIPAALRLSMRQLHLYTKWMVALKCLHALSMCIACRTYASYADDLEQLAGSLGVQQFYVIGVSGGGPYTYAAAAYLPDRVLGVMTISTLAQAGACQTHSCIVSASSLLPTISVHQL